MERKGQPRSPGQRAVVLLMAAVVTAGHAFTAVSGDGAASLTSQAKQLAEKLMPELRALPHDLDVDNFDSTLAALPGGTMILMEFYASWCPACRAFKPNYDRIGAFFNGHQGLDGPPVWVGRIDCADEENMRQVCDKFKLKGFPTMFFGAWPDFEARTPDLVSAGRSPEGILMWISKKTGVGSYRYKEADLWQGGEALLQESIPVSKPPAMARASQTFVDLQDVVSATVQGLSYIISSKNLLGLPEARSALEGWVRLLAIAHPTPMCQKGSAQLASRFQEVWPLASRTGPSASLDKFRVCGRSNDAVAWRSCEGSRPDTRGYTCGVWSLLHSTAVNLPEDGGAFWIETVKGYIGNFFQCADCARHFMIRIQQSDALEVATRRDAVLWIWRVHNQVNGRLKKEEQEKGTGDPEFPKAFWPRASLCPSCYVAGTELDSEAPQWDEEEVYDFLLRYYNGRPATDRGSGSLLQLMDSVGPAAQDGAIADSGRSLRLGGMATVGNTPAGQDSSGISLHVASGGLAVLCVVFLGLRAQEALGRRNGPKGRAKPSL